MNYRNAVLNDIPKLSELRVYMLNDEKTYSNKFNKLLLDNTEQFLIDGFENKNIDIIVALDNHEIIAMGCVNYFCFPPNDWCPSGKTAYIGNMFTCIDYRKRGIATKILNLLVEKAKNRNCERILLNTSEMGKELYKNIGFDFSPTAMAFFPFGIIPDNG